MHQLLGNYADEFTQRVTTNLHGNITIVDKVSDQYQQNSIKSGTRANCSTALQKVCTIVSSRDVKLPANWNSFIEINKKQSQPDPVPVK